jgi:hypothetical protein
MGNRVAHPFAFLTKTGTVRLELDGDSFIRIGSLSFNFLRYPGARYASR